MTNFPRSSLASLAIAGLFAMHSGSSFGVEKKPAEKIPSYAITLAARIMAENLTVAPKARAFPDGRRSHYPAAEIGVRLLAEIKGFRGIPEETLVSLLETFVEPAVARPDLGWTETLRAVIADAEMSAEAKKGLLELLAGTVAPRRSVPTAKSIRKDLPPISIRGAFGEAKKIVGYLPRFMSLRRALEGALSVTENQLIGEIPPDEDCYDTNPECQFESNLGLIHYYSRRIDEDHDLAIAVFRLHLRISKADAAQPHSGDFQYTDRSRVNVWALALDAARGDFDRAIEAIGVLGHDVCNNPLVEKTAGYEFVPAVLNAIAANRNSSDEAPITTFYAPGAIPGTLSTAKTLARVKKALANFNREFGETRSLSAGTYHVYGGMVNARALLAAGYGSEGGLNIAVMLAQAFGHAYKRTQIPRYLTDDGQIVWEAAEGNEERVPKAIPKDWDAARKRKVRAEIDLHMATVAYTEEQHRIGAQFVFDGYSRLPR